MDYEKAYKDALERANIVYTGKYKPEIAAWTKKSLEAIFPELTESEDEGIRKAILDHLTIMWGNSQDDVCGVHVEDAIVWLEKQRKTKWTEEDEIGSDATIELLDYFINYAPEFRRPTIRRSIDWLKSLKKRMEE